MWEWSPFSEILKSTCWPMLSAFCPAGLPSQLSRQIKRYSYPRYIMYGVLMCATREAHLIQCVNRNPNLDCFLINSATGIFRPLNWTGAAVRNYHWLTIIFIYITLRLKRRYSQCPDINVTDGLFVTFRLYDSAIRLTLTLFGRQIGNNRRTRRPRRL